MGNSRSPNNVLMLANVPGWLLSVVAIAVLGNAHTADAVCARVPQVPNTQSHRVCRSGPGWCELFLESHDMQ